MGNGDCPGALRRHLFPMCLQVRGKKGRKGRKGRSGSIKSRLAPCPDIQLGYAIRMDTGNSLPHLQSPYLSSLPAQPLAGEWAGNSGVWLDTLDWHKNVGAQPWNAVPHAVLLPARDRDSLLSQGQNWKLLWKKSVTLWDLPWPPLQSAWGMLFLLAGKCPGWQLTTSFTLNKSIHQYPHANTQPLLVHTAASVSLAQQCRSLKISPQSIPTWAQRRGKEVVLEREMAAEIEGTGCGTWGTEWVWRRIRLDSQRMGTTRKQEIEWASPILFPV